MTGPSAIGSENGTPSSITSAPASTSPAISVRVASIDGWPAVIYGTSARRPDARSCAKRSVTRSDEVVADTNAVPFWLFGLDDGAFEHAILSAVREVDKIAREQHVALVVADDAHDRPRQHLGNRVRPVHEAELECIQHHQRPNWIDTGEVHEGLHEHRIHAATSIVSHLLDYIRRVHRLGLIRASRGRRIEAVSYRDNLAIDAELTRPYRARITSEIDLHVVLVRDDHRPVMQILGAPELKQAEDPHPRMGRDHSPLVVGERVGLVQNLRRHA